MVVDPVPVAIMQAYTMVGDIVIPSLSGNPLFTRTLIGLLNAVPALGALIT